MIPTHRWATATRNSSKINCSRPKSVFPLSISEFQHQILGSLDADFKAFQICRHSKLSASKSGRRLQILYLFWILLILWCFVQSIWFWYCLCQSIRGSTQNTDENASRHKLGQHFDCANIMIRKQPILESDPPQAPPSGDTCTASSNTIFSQVSKNCNCSSPKCDMKFVHGISC